MTHDDNNRPDGLPGPGECIAGYTIEEHIGSGAFGEVLRAQGSDGTQVAVKIFIRQTAGQLFWQQNEIEALTRLDHPAVVKLLDFGFLDDERLYVVMEHAEGSDLLSLLKERGRLEVTEALRIVEKVAEALAHCHAQDILHLDLKPANIILTDPHGPAVKVLDFGLARLSGAARLAEIPFAGTPEYMAPETMGVSIKQAPDPSVDLYALGVVLYRLITGRGPFNYASVIELLTLKSEGHWTPIDQLIPDISHRVVTLIDTLLAPEFCDRISNAGMLADLLRETYFAVLGGEDGNTLAGETASVVLRSDVGRHANTPFVGRQAELGRLFELLDSTLSGTGGAIMVVAKGGIGKSRLIDEFLHRDDLTGQALVIAGRSREFGALVPYAVLREALSTLAQLAVDQYRTRCNELRAKLRSAMDVDRALLSNLVPELAEFASADELTDLSALGLVGAQRVARAVESLLAGAAEYRPLVVVLEDLHWSDDAALQALEQLWADPPPGVLLVGTTRPDERLSFVDVGSSLELKPMLGEENEELLVALTGGALRGDIEGLKRAIPLLEAGNPLFNTKVLRSLELEGRLERDIDGRIKLTGLALDDYEAPDSVHAILDQTVEQLSAETREVLTVASLFGHDFRRVDLLALSLFDESVIDEALEVGNQHYLCHQDGQDLDCFAFSHDSVRVYLEERGSKDRRDIHRRVAVVLKQRGVAPGRLAHHLEKSGDGFAAAKAHFAAALDAREMHNPLAARTYLERSFELLRWIEPDHARNQLLVETTFELARVDCGLGELEHTLDRLQYCRTEVDQDNRHWALSLTSAFARYHYTRGDFVEALDFSERCLALKAETAELRRFHLVPVNILGRMGTASGSFGPSIPLLTRGLELAKEAGALVELVHTQGMLGLSLGYSGLFEEGRLHLEQASDLAQRIGDPVRILGATFYDAAFGECSYDWPRLIEASARLLALAEKHKIGGLYLHLGTMFAGRGQFHIGRLKRAQHLLERGVGISERLGMTMGVGWLFSFLGDVHFVAGEFDHAHDLYLRSLKASNQGGGDHYAAGLALAGLAHHGGRTGASVDNIHRWGEDMQRRLHMMGSYSVLAFCLQRLAEGLAAGGDDAGAAKIRSDRLTVFSRIGIEPLDWWPEPPSTINIEGSDDDETTTGAAYWWNLPAEPSGHVSVEQTEPGTHSETRIDRKSGKK